jgi:polysaccharide transporter, PST family
MLSKLSDAKQKITPNAYRVIGNTSWLVADKLLRMVAGLVVGVWVARYLGPEQFGLFNYALSFVTLFSPIASLGLDSILVRELVQHPTKSNELLGSAFVLKLVGSCLSLGVVLGSIVLFRSDPQSWQLVGILAGGAIFQAFDPIDFWFQSQVRSKPVVLAKNIAFMVTTVLKVLLIQMKAGLLLFAWVSASEVGLTALGLIVIYHLNRRTLLNWRPNLDVGRQLLKTSYPMLFSAIAVVLYMKIDQIMLGQILGDQAVGIYAAATRISEVWYFIPVVIASSITPMILKARQESHGLYHQKLQTAFNGTVLAAYAISIAMSFFAAPLILHLYGSAYAESIPILIVHIWASIFIFLGVIRGIWMIAEDLTGVYFQMTLLGTLVNVGLNMILIPRYGGLGAAIATVVAYAMASYLGCIFYPRLDVVYQMMNRAIIQRWLFDRRV